jgi:hypothetical protein
MSPRRRRWPTRTLAALLLAASVTALASSPAWAKVVRHTVGHIDGHGAPDGPLGLSLLSDAVDNSTGPSSGNVYVLESGNATLGQGLVDKFTASGTYAGVQISGAETAAGSFAFGPFESGVAVDGSSSPNSGDVYVADTEHHVVDRFTETGLFLCQIAGAETEKETEEKTPSIKECDLSGSGVSGVVKPTGLAVDSSGDVYIADDEHAAVQELGPEGHLIRTIEGEGKLSGEMVGIALDSSGDLYVTKFDSGVVELGPAGEFLRELGSESFGVAVDQSAVPNRVYVDQGTELSEFDPSGTARSTVTLPGTFWPGLAVDQATGDLYAASAQFIGGEPEGVEILGPATVLPNVATEAATSVGRTAATLHGRVEPDLVHNGGDVTSCQFEYVTEAQFQAHASNRYEGAATVACEQLLPYSSAQSVSAQVTLAPSTTYHFRVVAGDVEGENRGEGEAEPEATLSTYGAPSVEGESASALIHTATLAAQIDPHGYTTTCELQYVDEASFEVSGYAGATTLPCPQALGADFAPHTVSIAVSGLSVGATYHYRFVASNEVGSSLGADVTFAPFGLQSFAFEALGAGGAINLRGEYEGPVYTQAGGHPYVLRTSFAFAHTGGAEGSVKDVETQLPAGLIGNPTAVARCTREQLTGFQCPGSAQVGVLTLDLGNGEKFLDEPIYNLVPPAGVPAEFGTRFNTFTNIYIDSNVRTGGDYGVTARVSNASAAAGVLGSVVELWGVPAAASHNAQRGCQRREGEGQGERRGCEAGTAPVAFLRMPTSCAGPLSASLSVDAWQDPGAFVSRTASMPAVTGCEGLDFTPSLSLMPTSSVADSPSGLSVDLQVPQNEEPNGLSTSDLRSSSVALPTGVSVDPSSAAGLQACSLAQFGLEDANEPSCPEASKIGTVEIETPLLADVVKGSVYVAAQDNNPFGSVLAIYIAAEADGAQVKLAGHAQADPETGQLTTSFQNLPQLPFSQLRLNLFSGPRGVLVTPGSCGTPTTTSQWGPWSGTMPVGFSSPFEVASGCVSGFAPSFASGVRNTQAGGFSPLVLSFSRSDSEQAPSGLSVTLPPGLLARIAGVPLCPETAANAGNCPEASRIGTVQVGAGAGPNPLFLPGKVYLTGPYKGAPYGESVVVPAIAGPYDFGDVVVRGAIQINPATAQATVVSDPFPTVLHPVGADGATNGIPVDLRAVQVTIDRPEFAFDPTSCERMALTGTLSSTGGLSSAVSSPFQVGGCGQLPFRPRLSAATRGPGSKLDGVPFEVNVAAGQGPPTSPAALAEANIRKVEVQLPLSLPSRLETLQRACTEQQFAVNPAGCPKASRVGTATARTPILPEPLSGPAYLVSHAAEAFPDLVLVLQGDNLTIELTGHTQIKKGITYSRFETLPDAPISSFHLVLPEGRYSLLSGYDICTPARTIVSRERFTRRVHGHTVHITRTITRRVPALLLMPTEITGQNGAVITQTTHIALTGCAVHAPQRRKRRS